MCLWCDRYSEESEVQRKCKQDSPDGSTCTSKHSKKGSCINELVMELKEMNSDIHNYSDPQYRLWARMIAVGIHTSKETPPQVPMITDVTPTRTARQSVEETVASTVAAVVKGMGATQPLQPQQRVPSLPSHLIIAPKLRHAWDSHFSKPLRSEVNASLSLLPVP